jgi:hypothetical protein
MRFAPFRSGEPIRAARLNLVAALAVAAISASCLAVATVACLFLAR